MHIPNLAIQGNKRGRYSDGSTPSSVLWKEKLSEAIAEGWGWMTGCSSIKGGAFKGGSWFSTIKARAEAEDGSTNREDRVGGEGGDRRREEGPGESASDGEK